MNPEEDNERYWKDKMDAEFDLILQSTEGEEE